MVKKHGSQVGEDELDNAAWVAARGATVGAAKWGLISVAAAGLGYAFSPIYRGLTFQFKVFLQMSGMTLGSMIEADQHLRAHERIMRNQRKIARDAEVWKRYEADFEAATNRAADNRIAASSNSRPVATSAPQSGSPSNPSSN